MYKYPLNSPYVSNVEKQIYGDKITEQKFIEERKSVQSKLDPLVNLQVYQQKQKEYKQTPAPEAFVPASAPSPYYPPQYMNYYPYMPPPAYKVNTTPIIKNYVISTGGPSADHGQLNMIYEDVLPSRQFAGAFNSLDERKEICDFIRSSLSNRHTDGEEISLRSDGDRSLLSYIKLMELNPYNTLEYSLNPFKNNPYRGLPDNMLIYNSCYPIQHDAHNNNVVCSRNSIGVNVRIYRLTQKEYSVNNQKTGNKLDYESWREIKYYEYSTGRKICFCD